MHSQFESNSTAPTLSRNGKQLHMRDEWERESSA